jgi:hypothetical protein
VAERRSVPTQVQFQLAEQKLRHGQLGLHAENLTVDRFGLRVAALFVRFPRALES